MNGDSVTPILIFRRLQGERKFLFESSSQYSNNSQYSYIGINPVKTIVGSNQQLIETNYHTHKVTEHIGDMFANLKYLMPEIKSDESYSFIGGALGYFSLNGNVNFTLLQQTMLIKNNLAYIQAGANILSDTQEVDAILETTKKIKAFTMIEKTRK